MPPVASSTVATTATEIGLPRNTAMEGSKTASQATRSAAEASALPAKMEAGPAGVSSIASRGPPPFFVAEGPPKGASPAETRTSHKKAAHRRRAPPTDEAEAEGEVRDDKSKHDERGQSGQQLAPPELSAEILPGNRQRHGEKPHSGPPEHACWVEHVRRPWVPGVTTGSQQQRTIAHLTRQPGVVCGHHDGSTLEELTE